MLNLAIGSVAALSMVQTVQAGTPVAYGVCVAICIGVCEVFGIAAGAAVGGALAAESCPVGCAAVCAPAFACLSSNTSIVVKIDEGYIQKPVSEVRAGGFVQTLNNMKVAWTQVFSNHKAVGEIGFLNITFQNIHNTSQTQYIEVTPEHELVLMRANNIVTISPAKNIQMDDVLIDSNGQQLLITSLEKTVLNEKYNLVTLDGTVLASDVFVTTMCNEGVDGERLFEPTIKEWQSKRSTLGELLPQIDIN